MRSLGRVAVTLLVLGLVSMPSVATAGSKPRPDALGATAAGGPFQGNNVYNPPEAVTVIGHDVAAGSEADTYVKFQNDGGRKGEFIVKLKLESPDSPPPNPDVEFRVFKRFQGDKDLTEKAVAGHVTIKVEPGRAKKFRVHADVAPAADPGQGNVFLFAKHVSPSGNTSDGISVDIEIT